jgi:hypothetical protein
VDVVLRACNAVMHEEMRLYDETSQRELISNGEFDAIYRAAQALHGM